jgi:hypothetical protein
VTELAVEKHRGRPAPRMTPPDLGALQGVIAGDVILPSSPEYEQVHKPVMARFHNVRPRAVVLCKTPTDVSETISFASRAGLETAVRSGGHSVAGLSSTRGLVIDVTPMHSVSVSGGMATVGAGFKKGLGKARVREVRFNDLRHTFGTRMAAAGVPMRTLQEWMGHRDYRTTLIYADYAPSAHEAQMAERAFSVGINSGINLSEGDSTSEPLNRSGMRAQNPAHPLRKVEGLVPCKRGGSSNLPGRIIKALADARLLSCLCPCSSRVCAAARPRPVWGSR